MMIRMRQVNLRPTAIAIALVCTLISPALAQTAAHPSVATKGKGGNTYDGPGDMHYLPKRDSVDRRVDMFFADWHESMPRSLYGSLILRDILTKGDQLAPPAKGAVLQSANFLSYGRLPAHASTVPSTLSNNQEVFYIMSGTGEITSSTKTVDLHKDIAILMPQGAQFTMKSTGDEDLTMYILDEPVPTGFHPKPEMISTDERKVPIRTPLVASQFTVPGGSGHWAHIVRDLFNTSDGMATVGDVITVEVNPLTLGEPHPHLPGKEEVWLAIDGTSLAFVGPQLRVQHPGMAYMLRPDGMTQHSNINNSDKPVKFLWFNTNTGLSAQRR
ncbi:cupin domain-containing protein [Granulicella sp. WH15]|uniref:cupin domain-containing protein n=1 Tax=Granulicella sp. WH15 TaxID=2602070 RepID=UPI001366970E|nr:cupin domain-containing protein [Granulicella sp. WH15]QHN03964.1 cupin domain-containing protein [Granulicella sp. WH15]